MSTRKIHDSPAKLVPLCHHRFALPALAALHQLGGGAKLVTLQHRLSTSRESVQRGLRRLEKLGLVRRNPGYGHPMRPEYLLTRAATPPAVAAEDLLQTIRTLGLEGPAFRKWFLPALYAVAHTEGRFNQIKEQLPDVTARALTNALKDLQNVGVVERRVEDGYPPSTVYGATASARTLLFRLRRFMGSLS